MFKAPTELLWAMIISLVVIIVAIWPSERFFPQTQRIHTQKQPKDSVSGQDTSRNGSRTTEKEGTPNIDEGGQNTFEVSVLGIRPGEWLLGLVTYMLWVATRNLVEGADKNAERQSRAYIGVSVEISPEIKVGVDPILKCAIRNFGQTPAYDVQLGVDFGIDHYPIPEGRADRPVEISRGSFVLQPAADVNVTHFGGRVLNADEVSDVCVKYDAALVFKGEVRYKDAFGENRVTKFFYVLGGKQGLALGKMSPHSKGNIAT
jgi:hypothetical protein